MYINFNTQTTQLKATIFLSPTNTRERADSSLFEESMMLRTMAVMTMKDLNENDFQLEFILLLLILLKQGHHGSKRRMCACVTAMKHKMKEILKINK